MRILVNEEIANKLIKRRYYKVALVLMLFLILVGGIHAQTSQKQIVDWTKLPTGTGPVAIALANLDGQLGQDLIIVNTKPSDAFTKAYDQAGDELPEPTASTISLFYGMGDGHFWSVSETQLYREIEVKKEESAGGWTFDKRKIHVEEPVGMVTLDCDGNGVENVLVLDHKSPYIFNLSSSNLENISFLNWAHFRESANLDDLEFEATATSMAAGDFDGDGKPDLAITNSENYTLSVYQSEGNCNFTKVKKWPIGQAGDEPRFVAVGDINGDLREDLVVAKGGILSRNVQVMLGNGDGTFRLPRVREYVATRQPRSVLIGDFNIDGKQDLIVAGIDDLVFLAGTGDENELFSGKEVIGDLKIPSELAIPIGMVAKDFNRDGNLDLAVANIGADSVDIYLGNGDGTFKEPQSYLQGEEERPTTLVAGDLDGNGRSDLVVVTESESSVTILLNKKGGTFQKVKWPQVGIGAPSIAVGKFNEDDNLDLAGIHLVEHKGEIRIGQETGQVLTEMEFITGITLLFNEAYDNNGVITLMLGTSEEGKAAFTNIWHKPLGTDQVFPKELIAPDLNADGKDDLAVVNYSSNNISIALSQAVEKDRKQPLFSDWRKLRVGLSPIAVVGVDLDRNGSPDLVIANSGSNNVSILLNRGDGSFQEQKERPQVGKKPSSLTVEDFNRDGNPDLAVANLGSDDVSILLGKGDGIFQDQKIYGVNCRRPTSIISGDFDRENGPDLAVVCAPSGNGKVSILLGNGDGTFQGPKLYDVSGEPRSMITVDYDGDGNLDLLVPNLDNGVSFLRGRGDGTFMDRQLVERGSNILGDSVSIVRPTSIVVDNKLIVVATEFPEEMLELEPKEGEEKISVPQDIFIITGEGPPLPPNRKCRRPSTAVIEDFNNDALPDLVVTCRASNALAIALNRGDRSCQGPMTIQLDGSQGPVAAIVGDFNKDGNQDLAVANAGSNNISILLGRGDGTFEHKSRGVGVAPVAIAKADFDIDGDEDLAVVNQGSADILVLFNDGNGNFPKENDRIIREIGEAPEAIAAGDFNRDKLPDLAVVNLIKNAVTVYLNAGGTFQGSKEFSVGELPTSIAIGNVDGDNDLDLIVTNSGSGDISILLGNGKGDFEEHRDRVPKDVFLSPEAAALGDLNGDGSMDLSVVDRSLDVALVFLNAGDGTFSLRQSMQVGMEPVAIAAKDIDRDGNLDLAVINLASQDISILFGDGRGNFSKLRYDFEE